MKAASDLPTSDLPTVGNDGGFTLIEVVVAMGILAMVLLTFLGTRTDAMIDATEARNWRIAKELAQEILSELQAGAREMEPEIGRMDIERYENFAYEVVVGEAAISQFESNLADDLQYSGGGAEGQRGDRIAWQKERDELRIAQQRGISLRDYRDQQLEEELSLDNESQVPSEDDFEEVLVVVYFPEVRLSAEASEATYILKARLPTLAIEGMTPEEADALAQASGLDPVSSANPAGNTGDANGQ